LDDRNFYYVAPRRSQRAALPRLAGDKTIGAGNADRRRSRLRHRCSAGGKFPVIPAEPGIFSIAPHKCSFGTENNEANQFLTGQFP
jgi:hypothetical protein